MGKASGILSISLKGYRLRVHRATALRIRMRYALNCRPSRNFMPTSMSKDTTYIRESSLSLDNPAHNTQNNYTTPVHYTAAQDTLAQQQDIYDDAQLTCSSVTEDQANKTLRVDLRHWARDNVITQTGLTALLGILRKNGIGCLPLDSRTLLRTPTTRMIDILAPGEKYCHIGLVKAITVYMRNSAEPPKELIVDINIDGLGLYLSSQKGIWLILASICASNCARQIFVIGVYQGQNKPSSFSAFLAPLIAEAKEIKNYMYNDDTPVAVKLRCIICDAPARNSVLGTKFYSGFYGCGRCCQKGVYTETHGVTFPDIDAIKRTNDSFRTQMQPEHHHYPSPFMELDIDMIAQFPFEYLHTVCLGVGKKILYIWLKGVSRFNKLGKLNPSDIAKISDRLAAVSATQPSEFQRRCRSLKFVSDFKGTEFRNLLLYILPVVTHTILPPEEYQNLLLLHVALIILVDPQLCMSHTNIAQSLLEHFVRSFGDLYGEDSIAYNVHSLVHIVDDVKLYGHLDNYSAFPFESFMFQVKRMVLKHGDELAQIYNRVEESYLLYNPTQKIESTISFKKECKVDSIRVYKEIVFQDFRINNTIRNQWFYTHNSDIYKFEYCNVDKKTISARKILSKNEFYDVPVSSIKFDIYISNGALSNLKSLPISNVKCKAFAMPLDNNLIFAPLRHSV